MLIEDAMGRERDLVKLRFDRGVRCFAVVIGDAIAGYGWLTTGPEWIGELDREIRPRKAEAYIWNCVTLPQHRRKGVFRSLVAGIAEAARRSGVRRVWIGSVAIPAEKVLAPIGFRPAARFGIYKFLGLTAITSSTSDSPLGEDARRVISHNRGAVIGHVARHRH